MHTNIFFCLFIWNSDLTGYPVSCLASLVSELKLGDVGGGMLWKRRGERKVPDAKDNLHGCGEAAHRQIRTSRLGPVRLGMLGIPTLQGSQSCVRVMWEGELFCCLLQCTHRAQSRCEAEWCSRASFSHSSVYFRQWRGFDASSLGSGMGQRFFNVSVHTGHPRILWKCSWHGVRPEILSF